MPNRNVEGNYRYGYQGEYAEKEKELGNGINSFELRLWDSRIGRWLTTDPYRQFASPYLGVGNNPINFIDPDGGYCYDAQGNQIPCPDGFGDYEGPTTTSANFANGEFAFFEQHLDDVVLLYQPKFDKSDDSGTTGNGLGFHLVNSFISREYYIKNAAALRQQFTLANGTIDYKGGIEARTNLKNFVRNKRTPHLGKLIFDKFFDNVPDSDTPRFWRTNPLFNGLGRVSGVLGGTILVYDAIGVYNFFVDPSSGHVVHPQEFLMDGVNSAVLYRGGLPGLAWNIGWYGGELLTSTNGYQKWYHNTWLPYRQKTFGY